MKTHFSFHNESVLIGVKRLDEDSEVLIDNPELSDCAYIYSVQLQHDGVHGRASDALGKVLAWADLNGELLALMPAASGALKQVDLVSWYERNGFAFAGEIMRRLPRTN